MKASWFVVSLSLAIFACSESEDSNGDSAGGASGAGGSAGSSGGGSTAAGSGGNGGTSSGSAGASPNGGGGATGGAAGSGGCSDDACGGGGSEAEGGADGSGTRIPVFVAVGYDGLRIRSVDLGETWIDEVKPGNAGADDQHLLRAITFGDGLFVTAGYKIWTSPNGKDWEEQTNIDNQWIGGLQYGNGRFVATGGYGYCLFSLDAIEWQGGAQVPNHEASRSLAFGNGKFVTATSNGNWYESKDGSADWTLLSGGHQGTQVAFCDGEFKEYAACTGAFNSRGRATAEGVTIRVQGGKLQRSTNGVDFSQIPNSPAGGVEDVAVGFVEE